MDKQVEQHISYLDDGTKIETYRLIYGADNNKVLKEAWMYENGFSHADGFAEGWHSCFNTLMTNVKRTEDFGKEVIGDVKRTDAIILKLPYE